MILQLYSLYELLAECPEKEKELLGLFKKFQSKSSECNSFLAKRAIKFEKNHLCRTYFSQDKERKCIDFFFSVALSYIDKRSLKEETLSRIQTPPIEKTHIGTFLLAQIAKDENCKVEGRTIMDEALKVIYGIQRKIGGFCIKLDAIKIDNVINLYKEFDFIEINGAEEEESESLTMMHIISPII